MKIDPDLNPGETRIANAPRLTLKNGQSCVPQHYLQYSHSLASVEALISDISFCEKYPIFVSEDDSGIILQIGIIGHDNYRPIDKQPQHKIVFGRKWRVEPNLPSSEIIQTAFLAIKKAREHEIRELFTLKIGSAKTTPFNNHHDLPLMARNAELFVNTHESVSCVKSCLRGLAFDGGKFEYIDQEQLRSGHTAITLSFKPRSADNHKEFTKEPIILVLSKNTENALYHALINELISLSDQFVDQSFRYKGFARFSRENDVFAIAELSRDLRQNPQDFFSSSGNACNFKKSFATERYDTDITRVPRLSDSEYGKKLHSRLTAMELSNFDMLQKAKS